ncbi:MAG TPA: site-2 protease family protein [Candidatus Limnocylindria bacterium]|nr:site-2 protease family protein [Candidatus Limnocylindria bacterium]
MSPDALVTSSVIGLVILSITTHEASHGFVADRLGDPTARKEGRLTLNPLRHIDPFFTILLPLVLLVSGSPFIIGGAKPVPVDVRRLGNPRRDWALVGAAGPLSNLAIAAGLMAALAIGLHGGWLHQSSLVTEIVIVGALANVMLALFNLIPIPPLDGSRVAQFFLRGALRRAYAALERVGLLLILGFVMFVPMARVALAAAALGIVLALAAAVGVDAPVRDVLREIFSS